MNQTSNLSLSGVYVPLVTPFYRGKFDSLSLAKLIRYTQPYAAGYVPCLSSGEGQIISDRVWEEVVTATRRTTKKFVAAGIKRDNIEAVLRLSARAQRIGCQAVVLPVPYEKESDTLGYFESLGAKINLPIVVYNTEQQQIRTRSALLALASNPAIIAIKDSSLNKRFFATACQLRRSGKLRLAILQGMENQMRVPDGCDGHMVALANVEPELCQLMLQRNSSALNTKIIDLFWKYNLGGNWYVSLKMLLLCRGVLRSAEETQLAIQP